MGQEVEKQPLITTARDSDGVKRSRVSLWRRDCAPCIPARYVLALMSSLGFVNVYMLRVNISVALVQMDKNTATVTNRSANVFDWSSGEQGWVLSSFFIGYLLLQLPGGWLAQKFGGKWLFGIGILATSVFTLLTPFAANLSVWALVAVRMMEGVFEGMTFPVMQVMWSKWAPPLEISRLLSISFSGSNIGMIIGFPLSGILCEYGFDGGWPSVFYVCGSLGISWFLFWAYLAYSSPATHPRISPEERKYIESSITSNNEKSPIPWMEILTSTPFLANTVAMFTFSWGFYTAITCIPTYFNQALGLNLGNSIIMNGVYSAIPYVIFTFCQLSAGALADFAIIHGVSRTTVRKVCLFLGQIPSAILLLICGYLGTSLTTGVIYIAIAVGITGIAPVAINPNILEIAPKYAGITMAISNTFGTIAGIIAPLIAETIATEPIYLKNTPSYRSTYEDEWRDVFVLGAEILIFGVLIFQILMSGKLQPWANGPAWYRNKLSTN